MWFPFNEAANVAGQQGQGFLHFYPVDRIDPVQFDQVAFPLVFTNATGSTGSVTISMLMGLYTKNGGSLSQAHSSSGSLALTFSGTSNGSILTGVRLMTMPWTTTIDANRYYVAILSRTTSGGANATVSQICISQINSNFAGILGATSANSNQWPPGAAGYSVTTAALPSVAAFSELRGTASMIGRAPSWFARSGTE
jgi:hypothetical protein